MKSPGAELEAAEASNVSFANFCLSMKNHISSLLQPFTKGALYSALISRSSLRPSI